MAAVAGGALVGGRVQGGVVIRDRRGNIRTLGGPRDNRRSGMSDSNLSSLRASGRAMTLPVSCNKEAEQAAAAPNPAEGHDEG